MGSLASSSQDKSVNQATNPWAPQSAALTNAFDQAGGALSTAQAAGASQSPSDFVAQYGPGALSAFQNMLNYGNGNSGIPGSSAAAGGALTTAGAGAVNSGVAGLQGFDPSNTTANTINSASQYADNPATQGMIDAATRDARRALTEGTLPAIERNAAVTGNINSNRTGIAQGIAQRGLDDQVGDISAQIRGNQFNNGLNLAAGQQGANDTNRLGALSSLLNGGTAAAGAGVGANSGAVGQAGGLFDIAGKGVVGQNTADQAGLSNQLAQYQFGTSSPFDALNNYMKIIGSQNWGSTTNGTSTTTNNPSVMAQVGAGIGTLSSLFGA